MAADAPFEPGIEALVFDLYGTIVDMQGGLTGAVTPFLRAKGWDGDPHRFVTWWRRTHFQDSMIDSLCDRGHTPYRTIGERAVSHVMDRCGIPYEPAEARDLVAGIERLEPFPEVPAALERLGGRYRLAILSNGDPDMLAAARSHMGHPFEPVLSVAEAGYFKPHRATYAMAAERLGLDPPRILFVANHAFDCVGAKAAGMRTAFVNRRRRPFGHGPHQPDLLVASLPELAERLA